MPSLSAHEVTMMFLSLAVLLGTARFFGEIAKRFNQPSVLGEILAGVFLGPTVLGHAFPDLTATLFPSSGLLPVVITGFTTLAIALFLLVAGMEVEISAVIRQGKTALAVSFTGIVVPYGIGFSVGWFFPEFLGARADTDRLIIAMFFATAVSISALAVIAKTLMDLNIYRTDLGTVVISSAIIQDIIGWLQFAVLLGLIGTGTGHGVSATIGLTLGFTAFMFTIGRWVIHRTLPWVQAHTSFPGGVLAFVLTLTLLGAAFTEWIGIHAIFGAFMVGIAVGDSSHFRENTRSIISRFVSFIFAPLFFAGIGLRVDFAAYFDPVLVGVVLVVATAGKLIGAGLGARLSGMSMRESLAVGFAMNARGALEVILGLLLFQTGVIDERMYVALVVMVLVTSMMSGPIMQLLIKRKKAHHFIDYLAAKTFLPSLKATNRDQAIEELLRCIGAESPEILAARLDAVLTREHQLATGIGNGIAVPHARITDLKGAVLALGLSQQGIDFDAPDGLPAHAIFLILTPENDDGLQLEILADIAKSLGHSNVREWARRVQSFVEFLALVKTEPNA